MEGQIVGGNLSLATIGDGKVELAFLEQVRTAIDHLRQGHVPAGSKALIRIEVVVSFPAKTKCGLDLDCLVAPVKLPQPRPIGASAEVRGDGDKVVLTLFEQQSLGPQPNPTIPTN